MRKLLTKTLILAILAAVVLTVSAVAAEIGTGVVNASSLRLRSEPSLSSSTLAFLPEGTVVSVHEQLDGWYKVVYHDMTGYVSGEYLVYTPGTVSEGDGESDGSDIQQEPEETKIEGTISGNDVYFRSGPSTSADVIGTFAKGTVVEIVSSADGWCEIIYDGRSGYVSADYIVAKGEEIKRGIVTGSCVNVRSGPGTGEGIVTKVYAGAIVDLVELNDNWYYINYNGYSGYICADYVREYKGSTASAIGEQVVALAISYLGVPYTWGGASPNGFDCSGFTLYIYKQFGYSLSHSASAQWHDSGEYVERGDLQPGDMVFFSDPARTNGKACSHCGIYIGNGEFIHASSGSSGKYVRISSLTSGYYNTYYKGAKRLG